MVSPPPFLDTTLTYSRLTPIAKIICTIFSWNLVVKRGGHSSPNFREIQCVYAVLGGIKLSWGDLFLEDLCHTSLLTHTSEITHILGHFDVDFSGVRDWQYLGERFDGGSLKKMFKPLASSSPSSAPITSSIPSSTLPPPGSISTSTAGPSSSIPISSSVAGTSHTTPIFSDPPPIIHTHFEPPPPHPEWRAPHYPPPPPPLPRSSIEEHLQMHDVRQESFFDYMRSVVRALRLTEEAYFQFMCQHLAAFYTQAGHRFIPYQLPSFFPASPIPFKQHMEDLFAHGDLGEPSGTAHDDDDFDISLDYPFVQTAQQQQPQHHQQQEHTSQDRHQHVQDIVPPVVSTIPSDPLIPTDPPLSVPPAASAGLQETIIDSDDPPLVVSTTEPPASS